MSKFDLQIEIGDVIRRKIEAKEGSDCFLNGYISSNNRGQETVKFSNGHEYLLSAIRIDQPATKKKK